MNATLVMQDFETDSYWSIMTHEAIEGKEKGTKLKEIPVSIKMQWKDWVKKYPHTLVLSVEGKEDAGSGYIKYFNSAKGFRGISATDDRLESKEQIFTFVYEDKNYAVPNERIEGGKVFDLGSARVFFYRPVDAEMFYSTLAFMTRGLGFTKSDDGWQEIDSECVFRPDTESFADGKSECPKRINGFDTFWYTWSLNNPDTELLGAYSEEE